MEKICGVILAAGLSSRMNSFKMELNIFGLSMVERTVLNMQSVCDKVIIVCGYRKEKIKKLLNGYKRVKIVENERYERGMFSSVQAGLKSVDGKRVFIQPGDMPFVSHDVYKTLLKKSDDILIPVYKGRKGHPVLINRDIAERVLSEPPDSRLDEIFNRYGFKTIEVSEDTIHIDIDNLEDYKKSLNREVSKEKSD